MNFRCKDNNDCLLKMDLINSTYTILTFFRSNPRRRCGFNEETEITNEKK